MPLIKFKRLLITKGSTSNSATYVTFANFFRSFIAIISGIMTAKWLLPEQLGSFNTLSIFTSYIVLAQIGIPSGLSRDLPFLYGKKDVVNANSIAATSKYFMLRMSLIIFLISCFGGAYFLINQDIKYGVGSLVIGVTSFQGLYVTKYLKILYRSDNHFIKLAKITFINAIVLGASIILVYFYEFYGLCIRAILIALVDAYFTNKWKPLNVKSKWSLDNFKKLLKTGMPIYSVANIYGLWPTFQRTLILSILGTRALGLYALANIVQNMLNTFSGAISSIIFPKMSNAYGAGYSFLQVLKIPLQLMTIAFSLNLIILVVGWFLLPYIINLFLPNYVLGIEAAQWMLIVALINTLLIFSNIYMVVKKNHLRLISYSAGLISWLLYIILSDIKNVNELVIFSQALVIGFSTIVVFDFFIYKYLIDKEKRF